MNLAKTGLAVLFGFFVACALLPLKPAKAGPNVWVKRVDLSGPVAVPMGSTIVGFSCTGTAGQVACYLASQ